MPLQMARPRPRLRPRSAPSGLENFANSCGSRSFDRPWPLSDTDTATWAPSAGGFHTDGRRLMAVAGRVGEQVADELHDAPPVGHHQRQVRGQVDADDVLCARALEGGAGLVDQPGQVLWLGGHREGAGLDPHDVDEVCEQLAHVVGLLVDDPEELVHLCGVKRAPRLAQRGRGPLDGRERGSQLVADHPQELGAKALHLREGAHVACSYHHRVNPAVGARDRGRVDHRGHLVAVGERDGHLLAAHGLARSQHRFQRHPPLGDLLAVGAPVGAPGEQVLQRLDRQAQLAHDTARLGVGRPQLPAAGVEHHHRHRSGAQQGLEVGAGLLLAAVPPRVGDHQRSLRRRTSPACPHPQSRTRRASRRHRSCPPARPGAIPAPPAPPEPNSPAPAARTPAAPAPADSPGNHRHATPHRCPTRSRRTPTRPPSPTTESPARRSYQTTDSPPARPGRPLRISPHTPRRSAP